VEKIVNDIKESDAVYSLQSSKRYYPHARPAFDLLFEQARVRAAVTNVPKDTRFRLIKRVAGKFIRLFTVQQTDFNNHVLNLIEEQQRFIRESRVAIGEMLAENKKLNKQVNEITSKTEGKEISVIINTLNRAPWLKRLLDALMHQTYNDFEIIVVNGPSTDNTNEVLEAYKDIIKIGHCDKPNISLSRNIGIKAAKGEIIIFIDDDAVPMNSKWIEEYARAFTNDRQLGAVGGQVFTGGGHTQFDCGTIDIWGRTVCVAGTEEHVNNKDVYNYVPGGNGAYLKKAVMEVGGFDEYIEYYADEADLCIRLSRAGYKIEHHPTAHIYHENAVAREKKSRYYLDWNVTLKNQTYFAYKNSEGYYDIDTCNVEAMKVSKRFIDMFNHFLREGYITQDEYSSCIDMYKQGIEKGKHDGINQDRLLNYNLECTQEFLKINKSGAKEQVNVCLLLSEHIAENSETVKHTQELARCLVTLGINVHIVYSSDESSDYLSDGINYYSVSTIPLYIPALEQYPLCERLMRISYSLYKKVEVLIDMYSIGIIESPIRDVSGIVCAEMLNIPVITRLQTSANPDSDIHKYDKNKDMQLLFALEKALIKKSTEEMIIGENMAESTLVVYKNVICNGY
jgi:hypothetical protein